MYMLKNMVCKCCCLLSVLTWYLYTLYVIIIVIIKYILIQLSFFFCLGEILEVRHC